jgi:hypothetical protein
MGKNNKDLSTEIQETLPDELRDTFNLKANMEGVQPRLPQIAIVHQAQLWVFPDETQVKEFEAIILDTNRINAWWERSFDETGGGTPPDCFSMNGIDCDQNSAMPQSKLCRDCPKNKFGSDVRSGGEVGRGKACKNMKRVHIILSGELLPHRMTLPPSSLKAIDDYISRLTSKGLPYQLVYTTFKLKEAKNKEGIKYSEIKPDRGILITDPEKAAMLKKLLTEFKPVMRGQEIISEEYGENE